VGSPSRRVHHPHASLLNFAVGVSAQRLHTAQLEPPLDVSSRQDVTHRWRLGPSRSVLVVDDDDIVRAQVSAWLEAAGYAVRTASAGAEALAILETDPCAIVIADWQMPQMDGLELCRELRSRGAGAYLYFVLLTVRASRTDVVRALESGADDYVVKGASREELLARVAAGRRIVSLQTSLRSALRRNRRLASTDPLTGARNRRYLTRHLERELERCGRHGHSVGLLMCDLDHFKQINDSFGHGVGDQVLQAFVRRVRPLLRSSDWVARAGGEEFVVVLPETDLAGACEVGERICAVIRETGIATSAGEVYVTVSAGVASWQGLSGRAAEHAERLLQLADRRLYLSKERGRDRVTGHDESGEPGHLGLESDVRIIEASVAETAVSDADSRHR